MLCLKQLANLPILKVYQYVEKEWNKLKSYAQSQQSTDYIPEIIRIVPARLIVSLNIISRQILFLYVTGLIKTQSTNLQALYRSYILLFAYEQGINQNTNNKLANTLALIVNELRQKTKTLQVKYLVDKADQSKQFEFMIYAEQVESYEKITLMNKRFELESILKECHSDHLITFVKNYFVHSAQQFSSARYKISLYWLAYSQIIKALRIKLENSHAIIKQISQIVMEKVIKVLVKSVEQLENAAQNRVTLTRVYDLLWILSNYSDNIQKILSYVRLIKTDEKVHQSPQYKRLQQFKQGSYLEFSIFQKNRQISIKDVIYSININQKNKWHLDKIYSLHLDQNLPMKIYYLHSINESQHIVEFLNSQSFIDIHQLIDLSLQYRIITKNNVAKIYQALLVVITQAILPQCSGLDPFIFEPFVKNIKIIRMALTTTVYKCVCSQNNIFDQWCLACGRLGICFKWNNLDVEYATQILQPLLQTKIKAIGLKSINDQQTDLINILLYKYFL